MFSLTPPLKKPASGNPLIGFFVKMVFSNFHNNIFPFYRTENNRTPEQLWMDGMLSAPETCTATKIFSDDYPTLQNQLESSLDAYGLHLDDLQQNADDEPSDETSRVPTVLSDEYSALLRPVIEQEEDLRTRYSRCIQLLRERHILVN